MEENMMNSKQEFIVDVLVLGGGHAGLEAAYAASQFSHLNVAIVSLPSIPLASAPCNPAIGGVGKGQVVREIDALGGLMPRLADLAGIQYRTLNLSKGHAVWSTRVQIDKEKYSLWAEKILETRSNLTIFRDKVLEIQRKEGHFTLVLENHGNIVSKKLIITAGTFLNGTLHTGEVQTAGGRVGAQASAGLKELFSQVRTLPVRFKTGTPARLHKDSIQFDRLESQPSDQETRNFHLLHHPFERFLPQKDCFLTRTTKETLDIIRDNKEKSPLFNGQIKGVGPRYCPSIEDKAFRYPDRDEHGIFLEPEGLNLDTIYPNGVSTSLPKDIQELFLRSIPGLEQVEIVIPGYAVEYDVVDTTQLTQSLEYEEIGGLYFAGQVNGTSGYEEAAGQGLVAGINAALSCLGEAPLHLARCESYIGVMVQDLISNQRDEPYRLFTARSENRLFLREDNAVIRMAPHRRRLNLECDYDIFLDRFMQQYQLLQHIVQKTVINQGIPLLELMKRNQEAPSEELNNYLSSFDITFDRDVVHTVGIEKKYEGYIHRSEEQYEKIKKLDHKKLNWQLLEQSKNISYECRQRISLIRPKTFGELRLIEGIRPATLSLAATGLF
jgi:tRNA uridine 5-carboxymethylaminomethyl modification enzyme